MDSILFYWEQEGNIKEALFRPGFEEGRPKVQDETGWVPKKEHKKGLKIDSGTIGMESARSYRASYTTSRRFMIKDYQDAAVNNSMGDDLQKQEEMGKDNTGKETEGKEGAERNTGAERNATAERNVAGERNAAAGGEAMEVVTPWQNRYGISIKRVNLRKAADHTINDLRQHTVRYIFDLLFAQKRERLEQWKEQSFSFTSNSKVLSYSQETHYMETESTSFSTTGTVRTQDGREISFQVEVAMSRRFQQVFREDIQLDAFSMCDPLVINLDTDVAELFDQKFTFDIDADGEEDEISLLGGGSGYLALDQNGDGIINDGSELFGTRSGNGFADLAKYDEDHNGWIDENDAIWSKLQIWCRDENGQDILYRLADKGVGAICLQNAATDFALKGAAATTNGAIRRTGIFLYENGNVGTIQHVDLAKYS